MTIALWCVVIALAIPYALILAARTVLGFRATVRDPRFHDTTLTGWQRRAHLAHLNSFEAAISFSFAVLVAEFAHAPRAYVTGLAVAFIVVRCVYVYMYLSDRGPLRSLVFSLGLCVTLGLIVMTAVLGHVPP